MSRKHTILLISHVLFVIFLVIGIHIYLSRRFIQVSLPPGFTEKTPVISSQKLSALFKKTYLHKDCEGTGVGMLVKDTWHFLSEHVGSTKTCYITIEPFKDEKSFKTGITLEIVDDYSNKTQIPVDEYARTFVKELSSKQLGAKVHSFSDGTLHGFSTVTQYQDEIKEYETNVYVTAIGNTQTNTLYIFQYEVPTGELYTRKEELDLMISSITVDRLH